MTHILEARPADHRFTYKYSQPGDYHFCQDSVIFPQLIAKNVRLPMKNRVLDLCAGCGVIGLELAFYLPQIENMDFIEVQPLFREHFERNRLTAGHGPGFRFLEMNYARLMEQEFSGAYDLIVCNPPYFFVGDGRPCPSETKNRARFFVDSGFTELIGGVLNALAKKGEAYLLVKSGSKHGRNSLAEIQKIAGQGGRAERVAIVRGTTVVRITKRPKRST